MTITPNDTLADVIVRRAALFNLRSREITAIIRDRAVPDCCLLRRRWLSDRRIPARPPRRMTLRDLVVLNGTNRTSEYMIDVLVRMLGISSREVMRLRFLRAYRYFLACMDTLAGISRSFDSLHIEPTEEERQAQVERKNRGIASVARKYVQLMNGAVTLDEAYATEWSVVYEAFEAAANDAREQRNLARIQTSKIRRR